MARLESTNGVLDPKLPLNVDDPMIFPSFRMNVAIQRNTQNNILIKLGGGIGDTVCAEPAIRFACEHFNGCKISVYGLDPELFRHLDVTRLDSRLVKEINFDDYYVFDAFAQDGLFSNEFLAPPFTHCVDYPSLLLWRVQLPSSQRCVRLMPAESDNKWIHVLESNSVVVHPGRTWPSRTMPKWWWDNVLSLLVSNGLKPIIIGSEINHNTQTRGTVNINVDGCMDLRGKMSLMESVAFLQAAKVVLTNDSAPLHIAASGKAWIGFLSTVRHPEIITHYRNGGEFGWRMKNFAKGGLYQTFNLQPGANESTRFDSVRNSQMEAWLPDPAEIADWTIDKLGLKQT